MVGVALLTEEEVVAEEADTLLIEGKHLKYRKSRNFRVENISWGKFSCKIIFVGGDPLPYALAL